MLFSKSLNHAKESPLNSGMVDMSENGAQVVHIIAILWLSSGLVKLLPKHEYLHHPFIKSRIDIIKG